MDEIIRFVGPNSALEIFGIRLVGINAENGIKLLFTLVLVVALLLVSKLLRTGAQSVTTRGKRSAFWVRQGIHVLTAIVLIMGIVSIWFDEPTRLTTALGLVTAGLAFALQRVITALAGYVLILRGQTFNVGDRIVMGGVRGDVIALGFMQTSIMEMGQPPSVQNADPAMWVRARQYTGRIVAVSNARIFDEPVFNYTREFPYLWEEISIPIAYNDDWKSAERILLDVCRRHTVKISALGENDIRELERRYVVKQSDLEPRVFVRMTDNWLELTARFLAHEHGVRDLKDAIARDVLAEMQDAHLEVATATLQIVGIPPVRLKRAAAS